MPAKKNAPLPEINATAASLLGFLQHGPATGWDLANGIDTSVGRFWNVTRSQVYKELKTLAAAGLISQGESGPRDRQPFTITSEGRAAFHAWISEPPGEETMRMPFVLTVFFGDRVEPELLRRYTEETRRRHEESLEGYLRLAPEVKHPYQRQALECGIRYERAMLAWIGDLPWVKGDGFPGVPAEVKHPHQQAATGKSIEKKLSEKKRGR